MDIVTWQDKTAVERGHAMLQHASIYLCYVNYKGKDGSMNIKPLEIVYGHTEWSNEDQWLLRALNTDRNIFKNYPLKDVLWWRCTDKKCCTKCRFNQWTNGVNETNEVRMIQFKASIRNQIGAIGKFT